MSLKTYFTVDKYLPFLLYVVKKEKTQKKTTEFSKVVLVTGRKNRYQASYKRYNTITDYPLTRKQFSRFIIERF